MAAIKATRTWTVVLFVDSSDPSEFKKLPPQLKEVVSKLPGKFIPKMHITSANLKQDFGSFTYQQMKGQDFVGLFRDAKKKVRNAKKEDLLSSTSESAKEAQSKSEQANASTVTISNPSISEWRSAKGSAIRAKLLRIENSDTYIFQTSAGKTLKVKKQQLDPSSIDKAQKLIEQQS